MGHKFSVFKQQPPPEVLLTGAFVILSRFELLTSCLSSKRSKPTELKDQAVQRYIIFPNIKIKDIKKADPKVRFYG